MKEGKPLNVLLGLLTVSFIGLVGVLGRRGWILCRPLLDFYCSLYTLQLTDLSPPSP